MNRLPTSGSSLLDFTFDPKSIPILSLNNKANDVEYIIMDTSSEDENCGLYCLEIADLISKDDFINIRNKLNVKKRMSNEDLAYICCELHSTSLLIIQMMIDNNFGVDNQNNVLYDGMQLSFFHPKIIDNCINNLVILNNHGHYNLIVKKNSQIIIPTDIVNGLKSFPGSNYNLMSEIFFEFDASIQKISNHLRKLHGLF